MSDDAKKVRVDKYLWAIRMFKTRSQATIAIDAGKVKMNGESVKASLVVKPGQQFAVNTPEKKWLVEVVQPLDKRMKATEVAPFFKDLTPPEELERIKMKSAFYSFTGKRLTKQGRPTKKNRRDIEDLSDEQ
ncbi:MAG TPA: S4 domain-containing protein [Chitinophagales bacterium]|nr:S4 domain-containing protein [Chitinophagales bacterium]